MDIPQGYQVQREYGGKSKLACKLQKSLYGLKQASRQWNIKFTNSLIQEGFILSKSDYSLFTKHTEVGFIAVLVYVDIIESSNKQLIEHFKTHLSSHFKLKDLGSIQYFLGLEVVRLAKRVVISQRKFILEMLEEYGMLGAKASSIPMKVNIKLKHKTETELSEPTIYRQRQVNVYYIDKARYQFQCECVVTIHGQVFPRTSKCCLQSTQVFERSTLSGSISSSKL